MILLFDCWFRIKPNYPIRDFRVASLTIRFQSGNTVGDTTYNFACPSIAILEMTENSIERLEQTVLQLIEQCRSLQERNTRLAKKHELWLVERRKLIRRFELVEKHIDSSIEHLQTLQNRS